MSLPPGFLDELRNRVSISQVAGRKVIWDTRKSNQAKGDLWAPCPFHQEKTASFHVDDRKGFYYCFGCHAKGDAIRFVQETENVGFMEAIEMLAREAGMQMPAPDPQAARKADRNTELARATEAAVAHFRLQLKTQGAAEARAYLDRRGLDQATLDRFEIGFAADAWQGLWDALKSKGFSDEVLLEAGLAKPSQKGGKPYDTFRGRIMFPIRDPRGRCIAFGGRAMDPNDSAKYLNSPETALFDKGRTLYNHGPAREAAGKGQPLIVAEGYMDVIALVRAGFEAAVAPLGTAITEDQLRLLWRIADEPIIALDGDTAGLRAAMRLVDLALPMLEAGKTLRFCILPEGQDPDDLLKARGPEAMHALLEGAEPLVRMLWRRETEGRVFDTPERRAALDRSLRQAISRIPDQGLRRHYGEAVGELRRVLFRPPERQMPGRGGWPRGHGRGFAEAQAPLAETRSSALGSGALSADDLRVTLILATLYRYPELLDRFESDLDRLRPRHPDHAALADLLLATEAADADGVAADCAARGLGRTLESLLGMAHLRISPVLQGAPLPEKAITTLTEEFAKYHAARALEAEMSEALEDLEAAEEGDPRLVRRLNHAVQSRIKAGRPAAGDGTGAVSEDTTALSQGLRALIEARVWEKKSR
ncbi:DNA primase [Rhodobacterales bacterium HKCCSP123]|nr:DNA primase [Rhodobacterales bacterium HKCCSP123]